ncbi:hypothetical protein EV662_12611 [Rhodovulum marinum]|uniref:Uncharacterized protein n=1 Tax=Rhodovulum marinum TaxID=320662 RepID=A0A4R2PPM6_9RHOB|nr:hypothetical protein EV662_12611 [Rhodovulum marinum]
MAESLEFKMGSLTRPKIVLPYQNELQIARQCGCFCQAIGEIMPDQALCLDNRPKGLPTSYRAFTNYHHERLCHIARYRIWVGFQPGHFARLTCPDEVVRFQS